MSKFIIFYLFTLGCIAAPISCLQASSVGVKPEKVFLTARSGERSTAEILIINTGQEPLLYRVYHDDKARRIEARPSDFRLEPGGSQPVMIAAKKWKPGRYEEELSVIALSLDLSDFKAAAGIKLPVITEVSGFPPIYLLILTLLFLTCFLVYFLLKLKQKNNPNVEL